MWYSFFYNAHAGFPCSSLDYVRSAVAHRTLVVVKTTKRSTCLAAAGDFHLDSAVIFWVEALATLGVLVINALSPYASPGSE